MNSEVTNEQARSTAEVFSSSQVAIGTFIGGPIAAGFLLAHNFQSRRRFIMALISVAFGVVTAFLLSWNTIYIRKDELIFLIPILLTFLMVTALGVALISHFIVDTDANGVNQSSEEILWKWTVLVGVSSLVVQIGLLFSVYGWLIWSFLSSPEY